MVEDTDTISRLKVNNFTAFEQCDFEFSASLNLFVGQNGTGKTHILKLLYSITESAYRPKSKSISEKSYVANHIADKLIGVFRPDHLYRLCRDTGDQRQCEVVCECTMFKQLVFVLLPKADSPFLVDFSNIQWLEKRPVFLPPRELLSLLPGFAALYENSHIPFEETYRDTCLLLEAPLAKGYRADRLGVILEPIEQAIGGHVSITSTGQVYLEQAGVLREIHLVAEGYRKLAMVARLIATGHLAKGGFLFWDEPEANLNPKIIKIVARTILHLCRGGVQVFVATHSLFLLRELDILLQTAEFSGTPARFFGLHPGANGVDVMQGDSIDDIGEITSLREELSQSDRYLETGNA